MNLPNPSHLGVDKRIGDDTGPMASHLDPLVGVVAAAVADQLDPLVGAVVAEMVEAAHLDPKVGVVAEVAVEAALLDPLLAVEVVGAMTPLTLKTTTMTTVIIIVETHHGLEVTVGAAVMVVDPLNPLEGVEEVVRKTPLRGWATSPMPSLGLAQARPNFLH